MKRAGLIDRVIAKGIDLFIVMVVAVLLPRYLGPLIGFGYSLIADGGLSLLRLKGFDGQSIGKKVIGLQVRSLMTRKPITIKESILRNIPVGIVTFFAIIPVWGWIFLVLVGFPLCAMEIYLMQRTHSGHRLGDIMADTDVIKLEESTP